MKYLLLFVSLFIVSSSASAAPAVIAAFAYIGIAGVTAFEVYSTLAMIALAAYSYSQSKKIKPAGMQQQQMKQLLKMSRASKQVVYGETLVSGALIFAEEEANDEFWLKPIYTEYDIPPMFVEVSNVLEDGTYAEWLYMAVGVCDHAIDSVSEIYLDDRLISEFGDHAIYEVHNDSTTVDTYLLNNSPSWQDDMIGNGTTWLRLGLQFDRELFGSGVPTPRLKFKGRKIWDPRNDTTSWSDNAALVILDFFISFRNVSKSRIILTGRGSFIDAANLCDEQVTNPDGSQSSRYTINGPWLKNEKPSVVLADMMMSCASTLVRENGKIGILPGAWYGPSTIKITASDVAGDISVQPEPAYGDSVNTIKGTYIDPTLNYVETDFTPVSDVNAIERDGGELSEDMNFRFITNPYQAQRVADIALRRNLTGGTVSMSLNLKGMYCKLGRVVELDFPDLGLIGDYRVVGNSSHASEGVTVSLARDNLSIYNDAVGVPFIAPPLTNLPVGGIYPPTGLLFETEYVGEVVQGRFSWQIKDPSSMSADVRIRDVATNTMFYNTNTTGTTIPINGLVAGNYSFETRTVSSNGMTSSWESLSVTIGLPSPVTAVDIDQSNWSISLKPSVSGGLSASSVSFEYNHLQDTGSYTNGNPVFNETNFASSKFIGTGATFTQAGLQPDRWQHYWVRTINVYGKSEWFYVRTGSLLDESSLAPILKGNVDFDWLADDVNTKFSNIDETISEVATGTTEVTERMSAVETDLGYQQAAWQIKASVGDVTSSIGMVNDGTSSKVVMVADEFVLTDANNREYQAAPFVIKDGVVHMKSSFINELESVSITSAMIAATTMTSQNYLEGINGYKLWGDGQAEFNDVTMRGAMHALSGSIDGKLTVGNNCYIDGTSTNAYAAWFGSGTCWIKKNGDFYAANGEFGGTVKADKIVGDIVSGKAAYKNVTYTVTESPKSRVLTCVLAVNNSVTSSGSTEVARTEVTSAHGYLYVNNVLTAVKEIIGNEKSGQGMMTVTAAGSVVLQYIIPADTTNTVRVNWEGSDTYCSMYIITETSVIQ